MTLAVARLGGEGWGNFFFLRLLPACLCKSRPRLGLGAGATSSFWTEVFGSTKEGKARVEWHARAIPLPFPAGR